ncbi:hypothetical protein [Drosophila suzukii associated hytrosavirus 1]|nr:hypothetical protein [Drosophila suzukii associated hytrosavirus 1]
MSKEADKTTTTSAASTSEYFTEADDDDEEEETFPPLRCEADDEEEEDDNMIGGKCNGKTIDENSTEREDDEEDEIMDNADRKEVYQSDSIVRLAPPSTLSTKSTTKNKSSRKMPKVSAQRRQTIDSMDLRQLVLRNNNNNDVRSKIMQSFNLNKNQIIIDYNILAFMENRDIEDDNAMEARMKKFINSFKKNYKGIQHIEYKIDNKLYCAIDIIYFLPILFNKFESRDMSNINRKTLDDIIKRLDVLSEKLLANTKDVQKPVSMEISSDNIQETPITSEDSSKHSSVVVKPAKKITSPESPNDRNIRLYSIGIDFYLMCRKKQNFVDGQKNLEKKYGKCHLLKTWNNRTDVKDIGKLILLKFPHMKWNARTNILTNSKNKPTSEADLLTYLNKVIK